MNFENENEKICTRLGFEVVAFATSEDSGLHFNPLTANLMRIVQLQALHSSGFIFEGDKTETARIGSARIDLNVNLLNFAKFFEIKAHFLVRHRFGETADKNFILLGLAVHVMISTTSLALCNFIFVETKTKMRMDCFFQNQNVFRS